MVTPSVQQQMDAFVELVNKLCDMLTDAQLDMLTLPVPAPLQPYCGKMVSGVSAIDFAFKLFQAGLHLKVGAVKWLA